MGAGVLLGVGAGVLLGVGAAVLLGVGAADGVVLEDGGTGQLRPVVSSVGRGISMIVN